MHVLLPQDVEERGAGSHAEHNRQNPPESNAGPLLPQERLVVQPSEEITEALFGWLELNQVVIQDQLSDSCDAVTHTQHLLGFVDAFWSLPADEVTNNTGQGLDCGVEVLVGGLQIQLRCI